MPGWTFFFILLTFYVGVGGALYSYINQGGFDTPPEDTEPEINQLWDLLVEEGAGVFLGMSAFVLFGWPILLLIIKAEEAKERRKKQRD